VVPKVGCIAPWGALEVGHSMCTVRLFTIEVTVEQALGNWYHFIKPIHSLKNFLKVKQLLIWYLILLLLSFLMGCANRYSEECFL
jgi:hypothetical protein